MWHTDIVATMVINWSPQFFWTNQFFALKQSRLLQLINNKLLCFKLKNKLVWRKLGNQLITIEVSTWIRHIALTFKGLILDKD